MKGEKDMIKELNYKTKMEAFELRKASQEKKIVANFLSEEEKELFKKKVLEFLLKKDIVELQNLIKHDFWDNSIMLQNNKFSVLTYLISKKYIDERMVILDYTICKDGNIREFYIILETEPIITEEGKKELERLKKIYGE